MTKCVIMGDIGKKTRYHVGDEAMTEAAIDRLRAGGVDELTLIATDPAVAAAFYDLPAVARFGFSFRWPRHRLDASLAEISGALDADTPLHRAVREADAVLIAGGGNMSSPYAYQLYERVALTRLARHHGTPLYVTSQTIGPTLTARDRELLGEILAYATSFGTREEASTRLALESGGRPGQVVHTLDDAALLTPKEADRSAVAALGLPERYIVAGLADTAGTSGLSMAEYAGLAARTLDTLATKLDAEVVIAPNMGSFDGAPVADQLFGDTVISASRSKRLRVLPTLPARQHTVLAERAALTLTTRYHPAVFAAAAGTPVAAVSLSYYSSVRLRGCLGNVGLAGFVVPSCSWNVAAKAAHEIATRSDIGRHSESVLHAVQPIQEAWWGSLTHAMRTGTWNAPDSLPEVQALVPTGAWRRTVALTEPLFEALGEARVTQGLAEKEGGEARILLKESTRRSDALTVENARLERENAALSRSLDAARGRKVVRLADTVTRWARPRRNG
jgi:polysaccharide pyruvyl transferase WcaK-like protein